MGTLCLCGLKISIAQHSQEIVSMLIGVSVTAAASWAAH